jgi:hypothetical protein
MPEREMLPIKVYISESGNICIQQPEFGGEDHVIVLHPSQVTLLVEWLEECQTEAEK